MWASKYPRQFSTHRTFQPLREFACNGRREGQQRGSAPFTKCREPFHSELTASHDTSAERSVVSHALCWSFNEAAAFGFRVHGAVRADVSVFLARVLMIPLNRYLWAEPFRHVPFCDISFISVLSEGGRWGWLKNEMWMTLLGNQGECVDGVCYDDNQPWRGKHVADAQPVLTCPTNTCLTFLTFSSPAEATLKQTNKKSCS